MDNMKKLKTIRNLLVLLVVVTMSNNALAQSENIGQRGGENCKYEWWGKSGTDFNQNGNYAYYVKEVPYNQANPDDDPDIPKIKDVMGWHNTNNSEPGVNTSANSHKVKVGGNVNIRNVYGGYSTNGDANNNDVIVDSGTFSGNVVGGYAHSNATAQGNKVTINGGNYIDDANEKSISGGQGKIATGNEVIINGGTIACEVNGGTGMENNGIVSGNTVTINGGTMSKIFGGNIGDTNYSGVKSTNNTVNILTSISVTRLSGGIGDTSWGNTLNLGATGITVGDNGVTHFQTIALTKDVKLTEGATVLSAKKFLSADGTNFSDTLNLTNAVGLSSGASGTMTLLASETANNFSNLKLIYNTATKKTPVTITTDGVIYTTHEIANGNNNTFYSNHNKVALTNDNKNATFTTVPHISYTDTSNVEAKEVTLYAQPAVSDTDAGYKLDTDANNNAMLSLVDGFKKLTIAGSTWDTMNNNGTLGMNMPKTGINTLVFQETDNSGQYIDGRTFRVYDDGGKSGNYSNGCNGTLVITAPEGYIINVKSNSIALKETDYLEFFDNNAASGTMLGTAYDGSAIDYNSTSNQMTLRFVSSTADNNATGLDLTVTLVHLVALPNSLGGNATVTYFKSATMPTASDISMFTTPAMWANAGDWVVAHIVPNDGYWTDGQLLNIKETISAPAKTRGSAIDVPQGLTLLQADEYDAGGGTMKPRHDGAGWYYYQVPADHSFDNGYISSTIDVTVFDKVDLSAATIDGKTVTATTGDRTATITLDENAWTYDGVPHSPGISSFSLSNGTKTYTNAAEQVSISGSGTNAGSYTASLTAVAYGCLANSFRGIDFSISRKELTAEVTAKSKTYDGTTTAEITATVSTGINGETLTISGLTGTFDNANVGADKTVTVNNSAAVVTAGANTNKDNYTVSYPTTTTATITAKPVEPEEPTYKVSVAPTTGGTVQSTHNKASANQQVNLLITPADGYYMASLNVTRNGGGIVNWGITQDKQNNVYHYFLMPAADVVVTATFEKIQPDQNIIILESKYGEVISHVLYADPGQQVNLKALLGEDTELDLDRLAVINNDGERLNIFTVDDPTEGLIYFFFMKGESVQIYNNFKGTNNTVDESQPVPPDNLLYLLNNDNQSFLNVDNGAENVRLAMSLVANILAKFTPEGELKVRLGEDDVTMALLNLKSGWQIKIDYTGPIKVLAPQLLEGLGNNGIISSGVLYKLLADTNLEMLLQSSILPVHIKSITVVAPEDDDPTAINGFKTDDADVDIYDLRGRKMDSTNLRKGVYIRNGKKIVIR